MITEHEIQEKYGAALCALRSYQSVGFFSREYAILRSKEILNNTEKEFQEADADKKESFKQKLKIAQLLTYRELHEKMFLCIEDMAAIFSALIHPLEEFHMWIVKEPNVKNVFKNITDDKIYKAMKYRDISDYDESEENIVKKYREQSIKSHKKLFETILKFYTVNEKAYIRMKHGNSLFYNLDTIMIGDKETYVIPVEFNTRSIEQVDILLLNSFIYEKTFKLFQYIQEFQRILCEINTDFIENGGYYHPIGLVPEPDSKEDKELLERIISKYSPKKSTKYNINTMINLKANSKKIGTIIEFYNSIPL